MQAIPTGSFAAVELPTDSASVHCCSSSERQCTDAAKWDVTRGGRMPGRMVGMDEVELQLLIDGVRSGAVPPDAAVARLRRLPFAEVGDTLVDHHRALRQGIWA